MRCLYACGNPRVASVTRTVARLIRRCTADALTVRERATILAISFFYVGNRLGCQMMSGLKFSRVSALKKYLLLGHNAYTGCVEMV